MVDKILVRFSTSNKINLLQTNSHNQKKTEIEKFGTLKLILNSLGLLIDNEDNYFKFGELTLSDNEIERLLEERNQARNNKDFVTADNIREELLDKGIVLEDLDKKTIWKKN